MGRPKRNAKFSEIRKGERTFFVTTRTSMGQRLFQSERNAELIIDVLRSGALAREFELHDFVIMPDHVHLLITVPDGISIERAMQLIKGRLSYRMKKEQVYLGEVWQKGFSEVRVYDEQAFESFRRYISENPVKAGLVRATLEYPYSFRSLASKKAAAKAGRNDRRPNGMTEVMP